MKTKKEIEDIYHRHVQYEWENVSNNLKESILKALSEAAKPKEELNKPKRFNPRKDNIDNYFYISEGNIVSTRYCDTDKDNFRYKTRNCFKTKEEAEEELERILFVNEVRDFIEEENEGWEPNWDNQMQLKFCICFYGHVQINLIDFKVTSDYKTFKSREIGEKIIAKFDNQKLIKWWI